VRQRARDEKGIRRGRGEEKKKKRMEGVKLISRSPAFPRFLKMVSLLGPVV
jgi:hypothetical protein